MSYEIEILIIFIYNPLLTSIFLLHDVFKLVSDDGCYMKPSHAAPTTIKYCQIRSCNWRSFYVYIYLRNLSVIS